MYSLHIHEHVVYFYNHTKKCTCTITFSKSHTFSDQSYLIFLAIVKQHTVNSTHVCKSECTLWKNPHVEWKYTHVHVYTVLFGMEEVTVNIDDIQIDLLIQILNFEHIHVQNLVWHFLNYFLVSALYFHCIWISLCPSSVHLYNVHVHVHAVSLIVERYICTCNFT